jgi:hypothetical protein
MYGNIHRELALSVKHAKCSTLANLLWDRLLAFAVPDGRFSADPTLVRAAAFPLFAFRLDQIERAIAELVAVGLFHRYDVEGKALLVYHDWSQWGPRLKGVKSAYPHPPLSLCRCCSPELAKRKEREEPPLLSSPLSSEGGQERATGKPQGETPDTESVKFTAARVFKHTNGWSKGLEVLAEKFVSLAAAGAPIEFVEAEIPKQTNEAPWACCDRVHAAWKLERDRLAEAGLEAARRQPAVAAAESPKTIAQLEKYRESLLRARGRGMKVGQEFVDEVDQELAELRAAGAKA